MVRYGWRLCRRVALALVVTSVPMVSTPAVATAQPALATLDSARAATQRGERDRATVLYIGILGKDSTSKPALRELSALYSARGQWRDALPLARKLTQLGDSDFALERDLGQWLVWSDQRAEGLVHLRRAAALAPDSQSVRLAIGRTLTWSPTTRDEGLTILRALERENPTDREIRHAIASPLTWNPATRRDGLRRLAELVREYATDRELISEYASALSWSMDTRPEAIRVYEQLAKQFPGDIAATRGQLNILLLTERLEDALVLADSALVHVPSDTALVRARSEALLRLGRPAEAVAMLRPVIAAGGASVALREQFGYALLANGEYAEARRVAAQLPATSQPSASDWIRRGAAPDAGVDLLAQSTSFGLQLVRGLLRVSSPLPASLRVSLTGGYARLVAGADTVYSSSASASFERRGTNLRVARVDVGTELYHNAPSTWSAGGEIEHVVARTGTVRVFARRAAVEDSRRAASGLTEGGVFTGQVRANMSGVSVRLPDIGGGVVLAANAGIGVYTGRALRNNTRREFGLSAIRGVGVGSDGARVDLGVGYNYLSFAYDANRFGAGVPLDEIGGYWSPREFGNVFVTLGVSIPLTGRLTSRTEGTSGQLVSGRQVRGNHALGASTELRYVGRRGWDFSAGAFYLDNLSGFLLRQSRVSLKHAF